VGDAGEAISIVAVSALAGAAIGALAGPIAWALAALASRASPALALAVGPVIGVGAVHAFMLSFAWLLGKTDPHRDLVDWVVLSALGGLMVGPPWIAYVAVRRRGRRGLGVVLAASLWAPAPMLLLMLFATTRAA
jgi:hypothetical protein